MRIIRTKDYGGMSRRAAEIIGAEVVLNPGCVLGLATGSTPVGTYEILSERCRGGELDFSGVSAVNLDEYAGLAPEDVQSYSFFMREHLFRHININPRNTHIPCGLAEDAAEECRRYDGVVAACRGIDLQLLGIGNNGHIGFNEPGDSFAAGTHYTALTDSTVAANRRFFRDEADVPRFAYTMGIGTIMGAGRILLIASGESKAKALRDAVKGPITPRLPASVLQLHGDVIVVGDEAALSLL